MAVSPPTAASDPIACRELPATCGGGDLIDIELCRRLARVDSRMALE